MPTGKLAAQAGHAFTDSLVACMEADPLAASRYIARENGGSKVVLSIPDVHRLLLAERACREAGIPCALVTDHGHVLPPHFDGSPVVTALGIGPVERRKARRILGRFRSA